jgi:hypothetical protein
VSTQLLPVLTAAQANVPGPLHPAGNVPKELGTPKPVMSRPSDEANVMLTVWLAPTVTLRLSTDAVATSASLLPVTVLPPVKPAVMGTGVVGIVPAPPEVVLVGETLLLTVPDPQPAMSDAATTPRSSVLALSNISSPR